jgi:glycosyltransferase involved in cell wall biosynthesis
MKKNLVDTVIYFVPVELKYFDRWEYYRVDLKMLNEAHDKVLVANTFFSFFKLLIRNKINLVYFWWWHSSILVILISKILRIKVIGTGAVHMFDESGSPDFYKKSYFFRLFNRVSWKLADKNLFISKSQFRQITSHEKVNNPFVLKSSSIFNEDELIKISKNKTANEFIQFLTVCWLTKDQLIRKSVDKILKAISMLPENHLNNIRFYIVGGHGDGTEFLEGLIAELNLSENVFIEIDITNKRKNELYQASDLYIQPSYYEGFGNSVLEAMTYGTPCLVSSNTAQPEVVLEAGYIINQISEIDIYKAILNYSSKSFDEREIMINNVKDVVRKNHSYDSRLDQYINIVKGDAT